MGLVLFCGGFALYSRVFGWVDGLPPLPENYTRVQRPEDGTRDPREGERFNPLIQRLRKSFGPNCLEQGQAYSIKFESRQKGLLFAAVESKILEDGRVRLLQMSVAIFGKNDHEISTIHCDRAFLTFDQPVKKLEDMNARKVTFAELHSDSDAPTEDVRKGKVHITNNRKTPSPDDDIILKTPGPVYFVDDPKPLQPHIWTASDIELVDRQNRPARSQFDQTPSLPTVTGDGMRVFLTSESPAAPGSPKKEVVKKDPKKNQGGVTNVERVEIERNVRMNLWSESKSMVGSGGEKPGAKQPAPKKGPNSVEEKTLIQIQTNGSFYYNMLKDFAHFEIPKQGDTSIQEYVKVTRHTKAHNEDTLTSDELDIQFTRNGIQPKAGGKKAAKAPTLPPPTKSDKQNSPENDLEIETVHAWGKSIAVSSDQDALFAVGNDLKYDARNKQTIMKGTPMHAVKEGNLIRSPELVMSNFDDPQKQTTHARGPGTIGMGEINPKTQEHGQQAHWQDWLVVTKIVEQGKELDLVTLTGNAYFIDTVNVQRLSGQQLKVWLINRPEEKPAKLQAKAEPKKKSDGKSESRQSPHRVEATDNVSAWSPDLIVHKADYLNAWFKDVPAKPVIPEKLPDAREVSQPKSVEGSAAMPLGPPEPIAKAEPAMVAKASPPPPSKSGPTPKKEPEKKDPPIELRQAKRVEIWVNRTDNKNELDKVHTEGRVWVHQDKTPGNDRDVDIRGNTVDMENHPQGHYLIVTGNNDLLGEVHFDKISIIGDDIRIDQRDNTANVKGPGSMRMLSKTTPKGEKLEKPTWVDIIWSDSMELDGPIKSVRYEGQVQAKQIDPDRTGDGGRILCEVMQVWLDRPLYLNQAIKTKETANARKDPMNPRAKGEDDSPKIDKVQCDQLPPNPMDKQPKTVKPVFVEDVERQNGKLIKYHGVLAPQIDMDNTNNKMTAYGGGYVRIFQVGAKDPLNDPKENEKQKPKALKKKDDEEMKLTWVKFDRRMIGMNNAPKRSVFYEHVEVVHMPAEKYDVPVNTAKLPRRALYIRCDESFEVVTQSKKVLDKRNKEVEVSWQEMIAKGNVRAQNDEFDAWSERMTYSEDKSQIVFTGSPRNPAVITKSDGVGLERKTFRGARILYNTKTKEFNIVDSIGGQSN